MAKSIVLGPKAASGLAELLRRRAADGLELPRPSVHDQFPGLTLLEGVLDEHLTPASVDGGTETTAEMSVYTGMGDGWGDSGRDVTVTNRSAGFFGLEGQLIQVVRINGEWRPLLPFSMVVGTVDDGPITAPDGLTVNVYNGGVAASLSDTTEDISAHDRFGDLDDGAWVLCYGQRYGFEVVQGQCPS